MDAIPDDEIAAIRDASRRLVRELGFMRGTLAGTNLSPSAVHAIIEIGARGSLTAAELCEILTLEKSSVSRLVGRLIEAGELAEAVSDRDGRVKLLTLTERGAGDARCDRSALPEARSRARSPAWTSGRATRCARAWRSTPMPCGRAGRAHRMVLA